MGTDKHNRTKKPDGVLIGIIIGVTVLVSFVIIAVAVFSFAVLRFFGYRNPVERYF